MCFQLKKMEELEKKKLPDDILNQITTPTTVTNSDEKSKSTIDKDIEAMLDSDYDGKIFVCIVPLIAIDVWSWLVMNTDY